MDIVLTYQAESLTFQRILFPIYQMRPVSLFNKKQLAESVPVNNFRQLAGITDISPVNVIKLITR